MEKYLENYHRWLNADALTDEEKQAVIDEFDEINKKLRNYSIQAQIWGGVVGPVMNMIGNISFTLVAISGGLLAANGMISVGTIQAFVQYSKQFTRSLKLGATITILLFSHTFTA